MRAALFSSLASSGKSLSGARIMDIFAGVGSYGLEALSRGALHGHFVEISPANCRQIGVNLDGISISAGVPRKNFTIRCGDAFSAKAEPFDFLFVDPPYELMEKRPGDCARLVGALMGAANGDAVAAVEMPFGVEFPMPESLVQLTAIGRRGRGSPQLLIFQRKSPA
jgi:16S rRNA (guanine966-N2)-methyltransferase